MALSVESSAPLTCSGKDGASACMTLLLDHSSSVKSAESQEVHNASDGGAHHQNYVSRSDGVFRHFGGHYSFEHHASAAAPTTVGSLCVEFSEETTMHGVENACSARGNIHVRYVTVVYLLFLSRFNFLQTDALMHPTHHIGSEVGHQAVKRHTKDPVNYIIRSSD